MVACTQPEDALVHGRVRGRLQHHNLAFLWCFCCTLSLLLSIASTQMKLMPGQVAGLRHASS